MADATDAPTIPNKVKIEELGPCSKKLKIEVPAEAVQEHLGSSLDTLVHEAALPGFRKGRAPKRLVEKKFGKVVRDEAKKQLVASAYQQAIEENELKVVGEPISEKLDEIEVEEGKSFNFEVEVEIQPEFDMPSLEGIDVKKPLLEVTDEQVDEEYGKIGVNEGSLEARDKGEAGDYLTGLAIMTGKDGTEHFNVQDAVIQIPPKDKDGKGMILGILVDDLAKQVGKPKAGDTVTVKATGPEHHEVEAIRGDELTITFDIDHIDRIIPADDDTLVARMGAENKDQILQFIKSRMEQRVMVEQRSLMHRQIAKHLTDSVEMELPERLTTNQAARTLGRRRLELMHRGLSEVQIDENLAELRSASQEAATRELKLFFILNKVAEDMDVKVTEAEVNGRIAQIAASRGERPEKVRKQIIANNLVGQIYMQVREHKTIEAILQNAKVEDMSVDDFNKAMKTDDE